MVCTQDLDILKLLFINFELNCILNFGTMMSQSWSGFGDKKKGGNHWAFKKKRPFSRKKGCRPCKSKYANFLQSSSSSKSLKNRLVSQNLKEPLLEPLPSTLVEVSILKAKLSTIKALYKQ